METLKTKVAASTTLSAAQKATPTADANKTEADGVTLKAAADVATTKGELKTAHTGHPVDADLKQLNTDQKPIHRNRGTHTKTSTSATVVPKTS